MNGASEVAAEEDGENVEVSILLPPPPDELGAPCAHAMYHIMVYNMYQKVCGYIEFIY